MLGLKEEQLFEPHERDKGDIADARIVQPLPTDANKEDSLNPLPTEYYPAVKEFVGGLIHPLGLEIVTLLTS
jgi:hypothetical protein